ncbi:MAG: aminodeoxychorismate synthase component I [Planctomycetota bacterium]
MRLGILRIDEGWVVLRAPAATHAAHRPAEVLPVLRAIEAAVERDGLWAAGWIAYEAAPGFDPALGVRTPADEPLLAFGLFAPPVVHPTLDAVLEAEAARFLQPSSPDAQENSSGAGPASLSPRERGRARGTDDSQTPSPHPLPGGEGEQGDPACSGDLRARADGAGAAGGPWTPSVSREAYLRAIDEVHERIAAGATYQANLTMRLRARWTGDPLVLFRRLAAAQPTPYAAYLETDALAICSASPELFFQRDGETLVSRPMKGTAPRGCTPDADADAARALAASAKDCAENAMIVDMIRNDIGRVARYGTVRVRDAFACERYPTVWQLVSTVEGRTDAPTAEVLRALFPCASITGAPKAKTMEILAGLETAPRRVYTGAIGCLMPGRRARFSVAIRTAVVDRVGGAAEYGVGGGVVWDSTGAGEYAESLLKARVLDGLNAPPEPWRLLESLLWTPDEGLVLLDRHLDRLAASAAYFDRPLDVAAVRSALDGAVASLPPEPHKVRLLVDPDGTPAVEAAPLGPPPTGPARLAVHAEPVDSADVFVYHKTTRRAVYDAARAAHPEADDVLLRNERGEVTEATIANLVVDTGGRRRTPPVASGLLAGTFRAELLARGEVEEAVLTLADLRAADALHVVNSVRGWRRAVLIDDGGAPAPRTDPACS